MQYWQPKKNLRAYAFVLCAQKSLNSPTTTLKPGNTLPPKLGSCCKAPFVTAFRIQNVFEGMLKYICGNLFSLFKHPEDEMKRFVVYPVNKSKKP